MELIHDTIGRFRERFGSDPDIVVTVPGRVNIVGEHTDYNDGLVLPTAIDRTIIMAGRRRTDERLQIFSADFQQYVDVPLEGLTFDDRHLWSNYIKGVAQMYLASGYSISGADLYMRGNIPIAAGLSSSAAIEVASAIVFSKLNEVGISKHDLVRLARNAEIDFVGVRCGIMDQFVLVMGRKHHVLFLDCESLEYQYVPFPPSVSLIICDTGVRRELVHSAYNQRRVECEEAVRQLSVCFPHVSSLRHVSSEELRNAESRLDATLRKRARHVITENERVVQSVEALKRNDLHELGKLMIESHMSLRDDYEVSCHELDQFVDIAVKSDGVYGARMTGAGFGGCGIAIVDSRKVESLVERLPSEYPGNAGRPLTIYVASPDDGAAFIEPKKSLTPNLFAGATARC